MKYNYHMDTICLNSFDISKMVEVLMSGGVIAFPTDTVFGLACLFDDKEAIERVKKIKGRDEKKPLPMMCDGLSMIKKVAYTDERSERLVDKFCPGALTIIFKKRSLIADYVTNGFKTIGIRVPKNDDILKLIETLKKPILVTSCNLSGEPSIKEYQKIIAEFFGKVDLIVCKDAESSLASTIVDVSGEELLILREGIISKEELKEVYYAG